MAVLAQWLCLWSSLVLSTGQTSCPASGRCPGDWTYYCGGCYYFGTSLVNFTTAEGTCQEIDGHLVYVSDEEENGYLMEKAREESWIGLTTASVGDVRDCDANPYCTRLHWTWQSGDSTQFTNWASQEPTGDAPCVRMLPDGKWADLACDSVKSYICEANSMAVTSDEISSTTDASTNVSGLCYGDWNYHHDRCYYFGASLVNHTAAYDICQKRGAHLVYIKDDSAIIHLTNRMREESWIGLTTTLTGDLRGCHENPNCTRRYWTWHDGVNVNFTNWAAQEPTGDSPCVRMRLDGTWADLTCDVEKSYICEANAVWNITTDSVATITNSVALEEPHKTTVTSETISQSSTTASYGDDITSTLQQTGGFTFPTPTTFTTKEPSRKSTTQGNRGGQNNNGGNTDAKRFSRLTKDKKMLIYSSVVGASGVLVISSIMLYILLRYTKRCRAHDGVRKGDSAHS